MAATSQRSRTGVFLSLFTYLDRNGVTYALLGDTADYPHEIGTDIDLAIPNDQLGRFTEVVLDYCRQHQVYLIQRIRHESTAYFFMLVWRDGDLVHCIQLDVCGDYMRSGRLLLKDSALLADRQKRETEEGLGFYVAGGDAESAYYLLKKIEKGEMSASQASHISANWSGDGPDISGFFSGEQASMISSAATSGDWQPVQAALPALKSSLANRTRVGIGGRIREAGRLLGRTLRPEGFTVVFLGPDGSGKSSVIAGIKENLGEYLWGIRHFHLRPHMFTDIDPEGPAVENPHGEKPRSLLGSTLKLGYYWFDYVAGSLLHVRPYLVRANAVIFDRYYDDLLVDPIRYRFSAPAGLVKLVRRLIPSPDKYLILDAPAAVLQGRKQEVTFEETERQSAAYRELARTTRSASLIDASSPVETVIADACEELAKTLQQRSERRYA